MIGVNGPLVALFCVAVFVLTVCALGFDGATAIDDREVDLPADELAPLRERRATRELHAVPSPARHDEVWHPSRGPYPGAHRSA